VLSAKVDTPKKLNTIASLCASENSRVNGCFHSFSHNLKCSFLQLFYCNARRRKMSWTVHLKELYGHQTAPINKGNKGRKDILGCESESHCCEMKQTSACARHSLTRPSRVCSFPVSSKASLDKSEATVQKPQSIPASHFWTVYCSDHTYKF